MANTTNTNRLLQALMRIDPTTAFVNYVNTVKPYHTKILDVSVELIWTDLIDTTITEQYNWDMDFTRPDIPVVYDCGFGVTWDPPFGYAHTQYFIKGVTTGLGGTWTISGNHVSTFLPGFIFVVGRNNGGGNGFYQVAFSVLSSGNTVVTIATVVPSGVLTTIVPTATPQGLVYLFDTTVDLIISSAPETAVYPTANSFLVTGNVTLKYFEGALIEVDDSTNDGDYIVNTSKLESGNTRVWVKEAFHNTGTGRMFLDREGYDGSNALAAQYQIVNVGGTRTGASPTGFANNATVYSTTITLGGIPYVVNATGSANQTYAQLLARINSPTPIGIAPFGTAGIENGNIRVTCENPPIVALPSVSIVDAVVNPLFASLATFVPYYGYQIVNLGGHRLATNPHNLVVATTYTATITIDGTPYPITFTPTLLTPNFSNLISTINTAIGVAGTAAIVGGNIRVTSATLGWPVTVASTVMITNTGTNHLFAAPLNSFFKIDPPTSNLFPSTTILEIGPSYCRLAQAPDLHTDVFIHENIKFDFSEAPLPGLKFFDFISGSMEEDGPGDPSFNGKLPPTALTTGIVLLPTGVDGNPFDFGGLDESAATVKEFYGRTIG